MKTPLKVSSGPFGSITATKEDEAAVDTSQAKSSMFMATKLLELQAWNCYAGKDQQSSRARALHEMPDKDVTLVHIPPFGPNQETYNEVQRR